MTSFPHFNELTLKDKISSVKILSVKGFDYSYMLICSFILESGNLVLFQGHTLFVYLVYFKMWQVICHANQI